MSLIEHWFQNLYDKTATKYRAKTLQVAVDGAAQVPRLSALIHLLSPVPCAVSVAQSKRVVVGEACISLPASFSPTNDLNENIVLLDYAVVIAAQAMLRLEKTDFDFSFDFAKNPAILEEMTVDFLPGFVEIIERVNSVEMSYSDIKQKIYPIFELQNSFARHLAAAPATRTDDAKKSGARLNVSSTPELVEENEEETNPLMHCFEKVQTAEEYQSGTKTMDDLEDGAAEQVALDEVKFSKVIRTNSPAASYSESDVSLESQSDIATKEVHDEPKTYIYSEWSHRKQGYLKDWCKLFERKFAADGESFQMPSTLKNTGMQLRRHVEGLLNGRGWKKRYESGEEIDCDAAIRYFSIPLESRSEVPRLFQRRVLTHKDVAVTIAIDASLSSDSWVSNRRVLDVAKNILHILTVALSRCEFRVEICCFNSMTKDACNYQIIKDFEASWAGIGGKIEAISPQGYTRIGPVIRHAHHRMLAVSAKRKIILLIGDAKPTDYDPYEGTHGIYDVRKAIQEAAAEEVFVEGLVIAKNRDKRFQTMFSPDHFGRVDGEASAVLRLIDVFRGIMK